MLFFVCVLLHFFPLGLVTSRAHCLTSYCEVDKDNGLEGIITLGGRNISMLVTSQEARIIYKCFNQGNELISPPRPPPLKKKKEERN